MTIYGYARVSTARQQLDRQIANIHAAYPDAQIVSEKFTGTTTDRPAWSKLCKAVNAGDTIVFDEVSRMARNAAEGFTVYQDLYSRGINLVFLKEAHINTAVYAETAQAPSTGDKDLDETLIAGINAYLLRLARRQIQIAFDAAQAEVDHLHARVSEGMKATGAGEKIAAARTGQTYETKKSKACKADIRRLSRDFDGSLSDMDVIKYLGIARNSYYKYKRELTEA